MRIATYNVEWFTNLFDDDGTLFYDEAWSGRRDVTRRAQIDAVSAVFQALDADAVMVIEAPDTNRHRSGETALETFAEHAGLRARKALIGFANDTQQEIALLYDPDVVSARHDPREDKTPRFDREFRIDLDVDDTRDKVMWSKPPLELAIEAEGLAFRMIGVHAKSKAPHGARTDAAVMRASIANRRKQLAQCVWLRRRVEAHLNDGDPLIVLGDFNDGPGLDEYEKLFGRSGVEVVLGGDGDIPLYDAHADFARNRLGVARPATARFYIARESRYLSALLDYIMVSPDLRQADPRWRIWHPFDDGPCYRDPDLRAALLTASDHFPVTLDIALRGLAESA
ncbi:MAG: endonuclease/exonuclease/phosphatase family protein [Rhodobacteraceae bacterium]|nr:endonuclease/exonuclease/phosphatase family protein [Paracoccaceae bacterium]